LTVTETTIENKSVFVVDNSKKLKACPKDQCHCPCACKKSGGGKSGGGSGEKKSGGDQKDKKGGGSKGGKSKKGGKSHHDNGKHKGQN